MIGGNKLRRLPPPEEEDVRQFRRKRQELEEMVKQNKGTRQLINKLRQTCSAGSKKIDGEVDRLQVELKELVFKIDVESKKNKVLKELIDLTGKGLIESKKEGKVDNGQMFNARQKQLKKQEYDIEQVLQKHNEEIAKINVLKEQVSFSRRQRVVYSNLFKKIEKQIKVYEERFKETLLHTFQTESKKRQLAEDMVTRRKVSERGNSTRNNIHRGSYASIQMQKTSDGKKFTQLVDFGGVNGQHQQENDHIFITFTSPVNKSRQDSVATQNKRQNKVEKVNQELAKYQSFFGALRVHLKNKDCTMEQMVNEIVGVEEDNDRLTNEIDNANELIAQYESDLAYAERRLIRMEQARKGCRISSKDDVETSNCEEILCEERSSLQRDLAMMRQIYKLLSIDGEDSQHFSAENSSDCFKLIEEKVNLLNSLLGYSSCGGTAETESTTRRGALMENSEHQIDGVIERMDRYNSSEKILSKEAFYDQSNKELFKLRKVKSRFLNSNRQPTK